MSQNGLTLFKNFAADTVRCLKRVGPFWYVMHYRVNRAVRKQHAALKSLRRKIFLEFFACSKNYLLFKEVLDGLF